MKIFIVGCQATGKHEVANLLRKDGVSVGSIFTDMSSIESQDKYGFDNYEILSKEEVKMTFECEATIFVNTVPYTCDRFYEGLSLYEYDNNTVFVVTPYQFNNISTKYIKPQTKDPRDEHYPLIIWLDGSNHTRSMRHKTENRIYNYVKQEIFEQASVPDFIDYVNSLDNVMYFNNEESNRVKTIIKAILTFPELTTDFVKNFK